jgi:hypothetical protein
LQGLISCCDGKPDSTSGDESILTEEQQAKVYAVKAKHCFVGSLDALQGKSCSDYFSSLAFTFFTIRQRASQTASGNCSVLGYKKDTPYSLGKLIEWKHDPNIARNGSRSFT